MTAYTRHVYYDRTIKIVVEHYTFMVKKYVLITYSNESRPYLSLFLLFLLSYITLDVLRFYSRNILSVILISKVFVD